MQEARPEGLRLPVFRELIHNERPWKAMNPKASYVMHVIAATIDVIAKVYRGKQASQNSHVHQFPTQSQFSFLNTGSCFCDQIYNNLRDLAASNAERKLKLKGKVD